MHHLRASAVAAALLSLAVTATPASADVKNGRLIEVFHGITHRRRRVPRARGRPRAGAARDDRHRRGRQAHGRPAGFFEVNPTSAAPTASTARRPTSCRATRAHELVDGEADADADVLRLRDVAHEAPVADPATGRITASATPACRAPRRRGRGRGPHPPGRRLGGPGRRRPQGLAHAGGHRAGRHVRRDLRGRVGRRPGRGRERRRSPRSGATPRCRRSPCSTACPTAPAGAAATTAVTSVSPRVINAASDGLVTVSGPYADGVDAVSVSRRRAAELAGGIWTATVDASGEEDGTVSLPVVFSGPAAPPAQAATVDQGHRRPGGAHGRPGPAAPTPAQTLHRAPAASTDPLTSSASRRAPHRDAAYAGSISVTAARTIRRGEPSTPPATSVPPRRRFASPSSRAAPQVLVQDVVREVERVRRPGARAAQADRARRVAAPAPLRRRRAELGRRITLAAAPRRRASGSGGAAGLHPVAHRERSRRDGKLIAERTLKRGGGAYSHALKLTRKGAYQVTLQPIGRARRRRRRRRSLQSCLGSVRPAASAP